MTAGGRDGLVLVVSRDAATRALAREHLCAAGLDVRECDAPGAVLALIEHERTDVVLVDLAGPGCDGLDTCRRVRERRGPDLPIVVFADDGHDPSIQRALEAGATDFVTRPVPWAALRHRVALARRAGSAFSQLRAALHDLSQGQERLVAAQELAGIGCWEWDPQDGRMIWSAEVRRILGRNESGAAPSLDDLLAGAHPDDRASLEKCMVESATAGASWSIDHRVLTPAGCERIVHHRGDVDGDPVRGWRVRGTIQDVTERSREDEATRRLAYFDVVTGLPNRRFFLERFEGALRTAREAERCVGLLFVDIDRFKRINDTLGHEGGDRLLAAVADRLLHSVRSDDLIARLAADPTNTSLARHGGDEFTVTLPLRGSPQGAGLVAQRLLRALRQPFDLDGRRVEVSASVGIAIFPRDGEDAETLLRNADAAMYRAKFAGRDTYQFCTRALNERTARGRAAEGDLASALERQELVMHYQPLVHASSGRVVGVEALARWNREDGESWLGAALLPMGTDVTLAAKLWAWALRTVCLDAKAWRTSGHMPPRIVLAVPPALVSQRELAIGIQRRLSETELEPSMLEITIDESTIAVDWDLASRVLERWAATGLSLAIGGIGTGPASLEALRRLPVRTLQFAPDFVRKLEPDSPDLALVSGIIAMARRLDWCVVGTGVETGEQEALLRTEGCDVMQGPWFAPPAAPDEIAAVLRVRGTT